MSNTSDDNLVQATMLALTSTLACAAIPAGAPAAVARDPDAPAPVTPLEFRDAMASLGAAVHIITTDGPGGRAGFTASAVCSVTDSPPTILVCVNRQSSAYSATTLNGQVCINTLHADQHALSLAFSRNTPEERFEHGEWLSEPGRAPVLADAIMSLEGEISHVVPIGTHDILICKLTRLSRNDHPGCLIYYDRQYHGIYHAPEKSSLSD